MKKFTSLLSLLLILLAGCTEKKNNLLKLKIMKEEYPRAFFFRESEYTTRYETYEEWEDTFDDLYGFIGQACPYQLMDHLPGELAKNPEYFTRFKKDNPDKMVLMHLATNTHDPNALPVDFFAGHWLYYEGATITADVPARCGTVEIQVSDAGLFRMNIGFTHDRAEDIGLCMLDDEGKPNWNEAEQVQLVAVDTIRDIITVDRCRFGTVPRVFPAGKAYAAAHAWEGPWNPRTHLSWAFNYSTLCPRDKQGRNCGDMVVEYLAGELLPGGIVYNIDGLAFDVVYNKPPCGPTAALGRLPDFDADGRGDDVVSDSTYPNGVIDFFRKLRETLGEERIITSDAQSLGNQRAFMILNGCESERWPSSNSLVIADWSTGINRHYFWDENSRYPVFNYIKAYSSSPKNFNRVVLAGAVFTNSVINVTHSPTDPPELRLWDEICKGQERQLVWLGKPLAPAVHMALSQKEVLEGRGLPPGQELFRSLQGDQTDLVLETGSLKAASGGEEIRFQLKGVPCPGPDMTVFVTARGETRKGFTNEYARMIIASVNQPGLPLPGFWMHRMREANRLVSFVNEKDFTSSFYFSKLDSNIVDIEILVESVEPVWITKIEIYSHPDAMYREFEHGLVLANPSPAPYTFDLGALFPGKTFRRIRGNEKQDPAINDGSLAGKTVTLPGEDALFLVKVE